MKNMTLNNFNKAMELMEKSVNGFSRLSDNRKEELVINQFAFYKFYGYKNVEDSIKDFKL